MGYAGVIHPFDQGNESAKNLYAMLRGSFPESSYLTSQLATCFYNMRIPLGLGLSPVGPRNQRLVSDPKTSRGLFLL